MEVFVTCQLPANCTLLSISPPDLLSVLFSARRQQVPPMRICQAGSQTWSPAFPASPVLSIPTCTKSTSSSLIPHRRGLWLFCLFVCLFRVDNRNENYNHDFSTEDPKDFFFLFFYEEFRFLFFSLNGLFFAQKSFCHKIGYHQLCFFLPTQLPKTKLSWLQNTQKWCFLMYSAWLLVLEVRWKHLNHFPFQMAV